MFSFRSSVVVARLLVPNPYSALHQPLHSATPHPAPPQIQTPRSSQTPVLQVLFPASDLRRSEHRILPVHPPETRPPHQSKAL
ncbi:hypothetical protein DL98DRAFT_68533 [Cadophora sp. DSE1049]|nr:hypothetical protein DL98DRAFT_68533 [Cadophora sp. DSE1049]